MAKEKKSIFPNAASKKILASMIGMVVLFGGAAIFLSGNGQTPESRIAKPVRTDNTPGGNNNARYQEIVRAENDDRANQAEAQGGSSIPTILGGEKRDDVPFYVTVEDEPVENNQEAYAQRPPQQQQQQQQTVRELNEAMRNQMLALTRSWGEDIPTQTRLVNTTPVEVEVAQANTATGSQADGEDAAIDVAPAKLIYRAGSMIPAVVDTQLSSDYPGAVRMSIVSGPLRGAYVIATFSRQMDTVLLTGNTISIPGKGSSSINVVAVDGSTGNSGIASNVDRHYLSRYASLMGGILVRSLGYYGELTASENSTTTVNSLGGTTTSTGEMDNSDKVLASIGKGASDVTDDLGDDIDEGFNRAPTVTVEPGTAVNLFVLADIREDILN